MIYNLVVERCKHRLKAQGYLMPGENPIAGDILTGKHKFTGDDLKWAIQEYSGFSNEAIHMLVNAYIRDHDWKGVKEEIFHNIQEEFGSETKDVPHLEIMRKGYKKELDIETDNISYSHHTRHFLHRMKWVFTHSDHAFVAGAVLALEVTAVPEFDILDTIVKEYAKLTGHDADHGDTRAYIDGHKYFEIGHAGRLEDSIRPYINEENVSSFQQGFEAVVHLMEKWWQDLEWELKFRGKFERNDKE